LGLKLIKDQEYNLVDPMPVQREKERRKSDEKTCCSDFDAYFIMSIFFSFIWGKKLVSSGNRGQRSGREIRGLAMHGFH